MRKSKFKIAELEWYVDFRKMLFSESDDEYSGYLIHLEEFTTNSQDYDGPFRYIEECEELPFPPRNGIKYCVRSDISVPKSENYIPYDCYCYQVGKWWKYKHIESIFTELYIPQIINLYEWTKLKCPTKFLSKQAQKDIYFYKTQKELDDIGRNARLSVNKCLNDETTRTN